MDAPETGIPADDIDPVPNSNVVDPKDVMTEGIPASDITTNEEHYGSLPQQALTAIEGAGQGFLGPVATGVEHIASKLGVPGLTPEDIEARKEENPWTHGIAEAGGLGAGLLTGTGEAGLISKIATPAVEALGVGSKIGKAALTGAIETGLFQGGDEISKAMLGKADPEAPVASALAHMGTSALFGGALGGAFGAALSGAQKALSTETGSKLGKWAEDFGNQWKFNKENPNLSEAVKNEIHDFHTSTQAAADEVYGTNGLKQQAIDRLVPEMNSKIVSQNEEINNTLTKTMSDMIANPDSYPPRLSKKFQEMGNRWLEVATNPEATSQEAFAATQELKQQLQGFAKFDKRTAPFAQEYDFVNTSKTLAHDLREKLEDPAVWGDAAHLQKGINKAFVDFLPAQKDFLSKFATKVEGEHVIDPGKIDTYVKQLGNPRAEIKQQMMENYVDAAEKYREKIAKLHNSLGVESPIPPSSLNAVKSTYGAGESPGAQLANYMFHSAPGAVGSTIAHSAGVGAGAMLGGIGGSAAGYYLADKLAPYFEKVIGRPISNYGAETLLRALSSGSHNEALGALQYTATVNKGARKISNTLDAIFKPGGQQIINYNVSEKDREKLKKFIENDGLNKQLQNSVNPSQPQSVQKYAKGGMIDYKAPKEFDLKHDTLNSSEHLASVFPEQNALLNTAKGQIFNYLNSMRPQEAPKLPFDKALKNHVSEQSYNNALDIAINPLKVLNHVKDGTLLPEHVKHLGSMYPTLKQHLDKQIHEKILNHQMDEEPLAYKHRIGLSLFLGTPLDSSMTPASIMAAQPPPQSPPPQSGGQGATKHNTSKLGKSNSQYETPIQAADKRRLTHD